jgi:hypothetical protein
MPAIIFPTITLLSKYNWLVYTTESKSNISCMLISLDKANRLDVGNAVNPCPSEEDKKLVVVKSPNAVNPLVWDYYVSIDALVS